ncbi:hypothetical protein GUJ93_ZPchr0012g18928 [Zizania palustris]|uniref:Uncharacterized protein n=1 Tax=Zizania palustris TaxID=103762 RepID=A0A8J6BWP8_ZIZPA|nr:hypothetical protein GUJ93_ZPchr0012g18928 [Zizania palustris]
MTAPSPYPSSPKPFPSPSLPTPTDDDLEDTCSRRLLLATDVAMGLKLRRLATTLVSPFHGLEVGGAGQGVTSAWACGGVGAEKDGAGEVARVEGRRRKHVLACPHL